MLVLMPVVLAGKLLGVLEQLMSFLWSSLVSLCFQLRATLWLIGTKSRKHQLRKRKEEDAGEEENSLAEPITPTSVNYHFTRQCNYKCGFCFHTAKTSFVLPLEEAKRGLMLLKEAGESLSPS